MPIAASGSGYQLGDGNVNEVKLTPQAAPSAYTGTTVALTAADATNGLITVTQSSAVGLTTPTGANLDSAAPNARVDHAFEFTILNTGSASGAITVTAGSGVTWVGSTTIAITTACQVKARKTGDATWTLYRIS